MKKYFSILSLILFYLICNSNVFADTYFYGIVYQGVSSQNEDEPWNDPNGRYVAYAIIDVYDSSNNLVDATIADSCGYYEVTLNSADDYNLVVRNQNYNVKFQSQCWITDFNGNFTGNTGLTWLWYAPKELNIFTQ